MRKQVKHSMKSQYCAEQNASNLENMNEKTEHILFIVRRKFVSRDFSKDFYLNKAITQSLKLYCENMYL